MFPRLTLVAAVLGVCLLASAADPPAAPPAAVPPATQPSVEKAPAVDYLKDLIDNYVQGIERTRFFTAAGVDGELTAEEWQAAAGQKDSFVRAYDRWDYAVTFDRSADKRLNWVEAEAYRLAVAKRVLDACDKDKDGKFAGEERDQANAMLARPLQAPGSEGGWGRGDGEGGWRGSRGRGREGGQDEAQTAATEAQRAEWAQRAEEARKQQAELVAKYDADKNGKIDEQERKAMFDGLRAEQQKRELDQWDANKDGKIDDSERAAQRQAWQKQAEEAAQKWLVRRHDKDGDGKLNAEEQAAADAEKARMEQQRAEWENRRKESIKRWDADGDGQLSEAEQQKMRDEMRAQYEAKRKEMDANGDGQVSPDEMRSHWQNLQKKYDADGDGKLSDEERQKMMQAESGGMIPGGAYEIIDRAVSGRGRRGAPPADGGGQ